MNEFVAAIAETTRAIRELDNRFDIFIVEEKQRELEIDKLNTAVFGNAHPGIASRVQKLEIYATIIIGLTSTGVIGVIGYIIMKTVELVYTHP